ncbi:MAG: hypothetical protein JNJ46_00730 [Myxococcales bacterium]|jgi:hypothetical protein|nr:hypothetical protein [Myxococcales bacterium]
MQDLEFQAQILAKRPPDATHYRLYRRKMAMDRYYPAPVKKALRCSPTFEYPLGCSPGTWLVHFYSDEGGKKQVQHVGNYHCIQVYLPMPNLDEPTGPAVDPESVRLLAKGARPADPVRSDPGLIQTKIETRKRALIRREDRAAARDMARNGLSKEMLEQQVVHRSLRRDNHELTELLTRNLSPQTEQIERHYALLETSMTSMGIFLEQVKSMATKVAVPPPPVDYTPLFAQIASAARDIFVVALQRGDRRDQPMLGEDADAADEGLRPAPDPKLAQLMAERDRLRQEIARLEQAGRKTAEVVHVSAPASDVSTAPRAAPAPGAQANRVIERAANQVTPTGGAQATAATERAAHAAQPWSPTGATKQSTSVKAEGVGSAIPTAPEAASHAHSEARLEEARELAADSRVNDAASEALPKQLALQTPQGPLSLHLPDGLLSGELANLLAGDLWDEGAATTLPTPSKVQVAEVAQVIVEPPKMSEEAARRALASGGVIEALGGLLFFNPAFRQMLRGSTK